MLPCVIALSSRMGAGKSTIAQALSDRLGWPRVSFGDYVREVARVRGLQESRSVLQQLGESLVQDDPRSLTAAVLSKVNIRSGAVIDGVRHTQILKTIRELVAPLAVVLVYVETEEKLRIQRLVRRGMTVDEIQAADCHSNEMQVKGVLRESAVLKVRGDGDTAEAVDAISETLSNRISSDPF